MDKVLRTPDTRLVCFGGARGRTNSPTGENDPELEPPERYD